MSTHDVLLYLNSLYLYKIIISTDRSVVSKCISYSQTSQGLTKVKKLVLVPECVTRDITKMGRKKRWQFVLSVHNV